MPRWRRHATLPAQPRPVLWCKPQPSNSNGFEGRVCTRSGAGGRCRQGLPRQREQAAELLRAGLWSSACGWAALPPPRRPPRRLPTNTAASAGAPPNSTRLPANAGAAVWGGSSAAAVFGLLQLRPEMKVGWPARQLSHECVRPAPLLGGRQLRRRGGNQPSLPSIQRCQPALPTAPALPLPLWTFSLHCARKGLHCLTVSLKVPPLQHRQLREPGG